jgi:hypothetical protein
LRIARIRPGSWALYVSAFGHFGIIVTVVIYYASGGGAMWPLIVLLASAIGFQTTLALERRRIRIDSADDHKNGHRETDLSRRSAGRVMPHDYDGQGQ